jgi:glucan phosphoethanolaminetransferase (alkaline phosphatase superfamily)
MRSKRTAFIVSSAVIIFVPVALFGLMASVNEYRDQGIGGAVDCDGPLTVMLFIAPSLVVYAVGATYYAVLLKSMKRSLPAAVLMVLCVVMVFAAGRKAWAAYSEKSRPEHQQTCGKGW